MHCGILQGAEYLNAPVKVSRHHVGRGDIHSGFCTGQALPHPEAVDSAMFEEAPEDRLARDVLRQSCDARPEAADPANDKLDGYPSLRRLVERVDNVRIDQ